MSDKFKVTYRNDDGYVGGDRPHTFGIRADDLEDDMDEEALRDLFWERMEEDFTQSHVHLHSEQEAEFVAWAKEQVAKLEGE